MAKSSYEIMPRILTPQVHPGKTIELDIYISGSGPIQKSKLMIIFPSAITNDDNPGEIVFSVGMLTDNTTGKHSPIVGKGFRQATKCDKWGIELGLTPAYFLDAPDKISGEWDLPMKVGETTPDNISPMKLTLNTRQDSPAGDYDIRLVLTYSTSRYHDEIKTSKETVSVHVTSWVERHAKAIAVISIVLAATAIVAAIVTTR